MRILFVGGTMFVGRAMAAAAIDAGHDVTLLHRGQTGDDLFPTATHLHADRNGDLSELATGEWDATIDVNAYLPRQVETLAAALGGRGGHHVYISTVSVYRDPDGPGADEDRRCGIRRPTMSTRSPARRTPAEGGLRTGGEETLRRGAHARPSDVRGGTARSNVPGSRHWPSGQRESELLAAWSTRP